MYSKTRLKALDSLQLPALELGGVGTGGAQGGGKARSRVDVRAAGISAAEASAAVEIKRVEALLGFVAAGKQPNPRNLNGLQVACMTVVSRPYDAKRKITVREQRLVNDCFEALKWITELKIEAIRYEMYREAPDAAGLKPQGKSR